MSKRKNKKGGQKIGQNFFKNNADMPMWFYKQRHAKNWWAKKKKKKIALNFWKKECKKKFFYMQTCLKINTAYNTLFIISNVFIPFYLLIINNFS